MIELPSLEESPKVVPRLTIEQRRHMLGGILSDELLFATARMRLLPKFLNEPEETAYLAVWITALKLAEDYGIGALFEARDQVKITMDTQVAMLFRAHEESFPMTHWDAAVGKEFGFLEWLYKECSPTDFNIRYCERLMASFLRERAINDVWHKLSRETEVGVVENLPQIIRELSEREQELCAFGIDPVESGAPEGWTPPVIIRKPTTIKWLDSFLRGGHRAGETYLVSGANGAGKTTLGLQIAQGVAANELFLASPLVMPKDLEKIGWDKSVTYQPGYAYYFHYEMSRDDIRNKLWSSAAMIDYDKIANMGILPLSTASNLSPEEMAILKVAIEQMEVRMEDFPGEAERLEMAKKSLRANFRQVDCRGGVPGLGTGYIPEIAAILSSEKRKGCRPSVVVIDYASACVERHTQDKDQTYALLAQFCRRCEEEIAIPFQTPVWILQQLAGEANQRTAATKQSHAATKGCKSMGDTPWFAFNMGTADEKTGCKYFTCSKARRGDLGTPPVLKIANGFNRLIDVSSQFSFNTRGKVVSRDSGSAKGKNLTESEEKKDTPPVENTPQNYDPLNPESQPKPPDQYAP